MTSDNQDDLPCDSIGKRSYDIDYDSSNLSSCIVGVGGYGCMAIHALMQQPVRNIKLIAVDTDWVRARITDAHYRVEMGDGLGAGGDIVTGTATALRTRDRFQGLLKGAGMVYIIAGMGGGTGGGAAPVIAAVAKDAGALTVALVTTPSSIEGKRRNENAKKGLAGLAETADAVIVVPGDTLLAAVHKPAIGVRGFPAMDALFFDLARHITNGLTNSIKRPSLINVTLQDLREFLCGAGRVSAGFGRSGQSFVRAVEDVVRGPLLRDSPIEAKKYFLLVSTDPGFSGMILPTFQQASNVLEEGGITWQSDMLLAVTTLDGDDDCRVTLLAIEGERTKDFRTGDILDVK